MKTFELRSLGSMVTFFQICMTTTDISNSLSSWFGRELQD